MRLKDAFSRTVLVDNPVVIERADPDWVRTWEAGRDLLLRIENPGVDVEAQDVLDQIEDLPRAVRNAPR